MSDTIQANDVYDHPAYKEMQRKINFAEKQIFSDRNTINQMATRIHELQLRIMSLTRQLEEPSQP